ncbi:uncharacterized protein LOC108909223 [Anoplophora glabripennis]|uniref:uncharacterized protein LOC108909223 n=1 Tax=Anoplophora glabripennis TaxID=217634 RepID=UPI000874A6B0|nr:uncharacterized protein LOC108909223 [Anoplophora glabripennis]
MCVNVVLLLGLLQTCYSGPITYGPPRVETKPNLLDSFIPAAMQVISHVTELMKYDLKPTTNPPLGPTTSTMRPTPPHRPGLYAPEKPPGPAAYYAQKGLSYREYIERLRQPSGINYFDRYRYPLTEGDFLALSENSRESSGRSYSVADGEEGPPASAESVDLEYYFGKNFVDVLNLATKVEPDAVPNSVDEQVQDFSREFDDSNFRYELYRQKKVPPTKAYVTLLSLYDLLNKESKRLGLNKYQGYSDAVLQVLIESSKESSAYQLRTVLNKIIERSDTKKPDIVKKIKQLVTDLDEHSSYINNALRYIPALPFVS